MGWMAPDGSYFIAPACAGVNFMILVLTVSVLGFAHRMRSPGSRLAWWLASLLGAYVLTIGVNTARILAAVELYRAGSVSGLTAEQAHRLLGIVLYLGALWGVFALLDRLTRRGHAPATLAAVLLVPGAYLGMTLLVPLLNGSFRHLGGESVEHVLVVSGVTMAALVLFLLAQRFPKRRRQDG
jgi:exosortase/archaeosortase family protein